MADSLFHNKLCELIGAEIGSQLEALGSGSCDDFAEYKYRAGVISGLQQALDFSDDVKKQILGDDRYE